MDSKFKSMRYFIAAVLLFLFSNVSFSQETNSTKELSKKEKRAIRKKEANEKLKKLHLLMEGQAWIIKVTNVSTLEGNQVNLTKEDNFIYLNKNNAIIHLSLPQMADFNGSSIDQIITDGEVSIYQLKEFTENQEVECLIRLVGDLGNQLKLEISILSTGETKVIITNESGVNFTFSGDIELTNETPVIEGN